MSDPDRTPLPLGIFARTFARPTCEGVLDAVAAHGLSHVQFNLSVAGLPTLPGPDAPLEDVAGRVADAFASRGLTMAAVSGTFNMAHPDPSHRAAHVGALARLASVCGRMGTAVVTLCTGTRDPSDMWRFHPGNAEPDAWRDLVATVRSALAATEGTGVTLAFEPEVADVVDSAAKARRLLDEVGSPRLKVVIDPANLFHAGDLSRMAGVLDDAFERLGPDVVLAHAKDLTRDGEAGNQAAGTGVLDYDRYVTLLLRSGYRGPLILHGLGEGEVAGSVAFLRDRLAASSALTPGPDRV